MPLDPRTAKSLLKLAREYSKDFSEIELSSEGFTLRVKRGTDPVQTAHVEEKKQIQPPKRHAIDSLRIDTPVFHS